MAKEETKTPFVLIGETFAVRNENGVPHLVIAIADPETKRRFYMTVDVKKDAKRKLAYALMFKNLEIHEKSSK